MGEQEAILNAHNKRPSDTDLTGAEAKRLLTRSQLSLCKICEKPVEGTKTVSCWVCLLPFHHSCIGITEIFVNYLQQNSVDWACYLCEKSTSDSVNKKLDNLQAKLNQNKRDLEAKINRIEANQKTQVATVDKIIETVTKVNKINDHKFTSITNDIVYLQAQNRNKNFLISGIPKEEGENLKTVIVKIATYLKYRVAAEDILKVHRIKNKNTAQQLDANRNSEQVLLVFTRIEVAEGFFSSYLELISTKQYLTSDKIGFINNKTRLYINKQLPPALNQLYIAAKKLKQEGKVQRITTKTTTIAMQINGKWFKVSSEEQLRKLVSTGGAATTTQTAQ